MKGGDNMDIRELHNNSENYQKIKKFYDENEDFRRYVNEYRRGKGISLEVTLTLKVVENVALYYMERAK